MHNDYGNLLKSSGRAVLAKQCYTTALQLQPALGAAWNNLGCMALDEGDLAGAVGLFVRAVFCDHQLDCAYTNLVR